MSSFLKSTTDFAGSGLSQVAHGVSNVATTATGAINPNKPKVEDTFVAVATTPPEGKLQTSTEVTPEVEEGQEEGSPGADTIGQTPQAGGIGNSIASGFYGVGNVFTSGASTIVNPAFDASKYTAGFIRNTSSTGFSIGRQVAKTGLSVTTNVAIGTADLAGTAVGGVVTLAADTSRKVFEPVASGLKAIDGLQVLGEGLEKVNGLPIAAVKQVGTWTVKAMNMSGVTPTFFDTNGDGVVSLDDTIRGLIVLGLEDKYARYAGYALHAVFSYPTSDSWIPSADINLPIHVNKMSNTRWGRNWGSYERVEWCQDIDIEQFFTNEEEASDLKKWKDTIKKSRQYFGILLLIFEWGTTWPFYMPPVPAHEIPFKDDIGRVVRTLLLPTILSNYEHSRESNTSLPPSSVPPTDAKSA
ncbi:uncharacterized protein EV420DRAFT_246831 [Desarmillaria tabescens]|uniref:EF-hand domain-containing protein n=1 Tax=Armillaria tabescens TaxID=1929756 RepID=A0AA39N6K1_ARMTA|nr:uncharacterized protein EV420DRAFT_246831 [Desarmillaria tabescens]KAK0460021.1 hypothetical protein EV420DRAFT_246831 [Desarmillaria tabescens]